MLLSYAYPAVFCWWWKGQWRDKREGFSASAVVAARNRLPCLVSVRGGARTCSPRRVRGEGGTYCCDSVILRCETKLRLARHREAGKAALHESHQFLLPLQHEQSDKIQSTLQKGSLVCFLNGATLKFATLKSPNQIMVLKPQSCPTPYTQALKYIRANRGGERAGDSVGRTDEAVQHVTFPEIM